MFAALLLPSALAAAPPALAPNPAPAAAYVASQRRALGIYFGEALKELRRAREKLEGLQENDLDPHDPDVPVAEALRRLDRAEGLIRGSSDALAELVEAFPPDAKQLTGWTPIEGRISRALELIDRSTAAAEAARLYRARPPIKVYPIPGASLALYSSGSRTIRVRGYYAVNAISPEFLAGVLVHEGTHALQDAWARRKGGKFRADFPGERQARERETLFWRELGAPSGEDFQGTMADQLSAYRRGPAAFDRFVRANFREPAFWDWIEPAVASPAAPAPVKISRLKAIAQAEPIPNLSPEEAARTLKEVQGVEASLRHNLALACLKLLEGVRGRLEQVPELLAPYPKIVNYSTMAVRAEFSRDYPLPMQMGYGLLSAVFDELDAARRALARGSPAPGELEALVKDEAVRQPDGPAEAPALGAGIFRLVRDSTATRGLSRLWEEKGWRIGLVPWLTPRLEAEYPDRLLIPGSLFLRQPAPALGAAWVVHLLVHRRQGLAPGQAPDLDQEVEAWDVTNRFWYGLNVPDGEVENYSPTHARRFLVMNALWERGGSGLIRLYLKSRGFPRAR